MEEEMKALADAAHKLERRSTLLGEVLGTLSITPNHRFIPGPLREHIDRWRTVVGLGPVDWKPLVDEPSKPRGRKAAGRDTQLENPDQ